MSFCKIVDSEVGGLALKCDCSEALAKIMQRSVNVCCKQVQVNNSPGDY